MERRSNRERLAIKCAGSKLTFEDFAEKYIELIEAASEVSRETIDRRASCLSYVCRYIGDMKLREISPQVVEATLAAIKRDKIEERGSFRNATLKNYFEDMKLVFQKALDYDFIMRNPCDKVKPIKEDPVERRSLDASEAARLLSLVDAREEEAYARIEGAEAARARLGRTEWPQERLQFIAMVSFAIAVRIGLATGMRSGEVRGLLWDCVNL